MARPTGRNADDQTTDGRQSSVARRRFLRAAGTLGAVGVLAGCSASNDGETTNSSRGTTPTDGNTSPTAKTSGPTNAAATVPEPPGERRPLGEKFPGLRVISRDPPVREAKSRATYAKFITPVDEHYVVNHYDTPVLDGNEYTVTLSGLPGDDVELSVRELRDEFSRTSVTHTMQCSGNGRAYFDPEISGFSLSFGAVGTAVWTGAPLREVLKAHGADTGAGTWLMATGADAPEGEPVFARSIPMRKAVEDCVLAYAMNGRPLPRAHGYPVRLVVPGWYGNNSVKWLTELRAMDGMVYGERWRRYVQWQQNKYRVLPAGASADHHRRIDRFDTWAQIRAKAAGDVAYSPYMYDQTVKSQVSRPVEGATVTSRAADGRMEVLGVAWAGDDRVERVDVSTDGGETWRRATFLDPDRGPVAWRRFRYLWDPDPGEHLLVSRATDERGRTQPRTIAPPAEGLGAALRGRYPWNQRGYGMNAYLPLGVRVTVET